ncbi:MAG: hypothetical protein AAFP70_19405 [Calditrichota bacterium]
MKKVTGPTFFVKILFPALWFGFSIVMAIIILSFGDIATVWPRALPSLAMMVGGFFLFRKLYWNLADEVIDHGDLLQIRKGNISQEIALQDIINIDYDMTQSHVTLNTREAGPLGKAVKFQAPIFKSGFFSRSPYVDELIERVDDARRKSYTGSATTP